MTESEIWAEDGLGGVGDPGAPWTRADTLLAAGWFAAAVVARAPFVARIEGTLDHDQSVVGLMALDIAAGRRFPVFFDGQRYMGAVEAYAAAGFVRAFGHAPSVVALAPLLAFGLFAAGQFAVWRCWRDRRAGHLSAALAVLGAPMLVLWGVVPRGGYAEFLAWALPTLAAYRRVARRGRPPLSPAGQAGWGFWLALGYFLNPLSMIVYATLALDWTLGRHGADLRRERRVGGGWLDGPLAPAVWLAAGAAWVTAMAACCHVDPRATAGRLPYLAFGRLTDSGREVAAGAAAAAALLGLAAWWTRGPVRLYQRLTQAPWALAGLAVAWSPFVAYAVLVRLGRTPLSPTLPAWIAAPWKAGANVGRAFRALGPLVGSDPRAVETVLVGQGVEPPVATWTGLEAALLWASPGVATLAVALVLWSAWGLRAFWARAFALRGRDVAAPEALAVGFLAVTLGLYALQGTSPDASSVRYLVPAWVALPGVLAAGLRTLPRRPAAAAGLALVVPWAAAQFFLWTALDRPAPAARLAAELTSRGVTGVVAATPVAIVVANLSHGAIGAVEYQPVWPRLADRYLGRFAAGRPLTCVVDRRYPWAIRGEGAWGKDQDLGRHLRGLAGRHPGSVRLAWTLGTFEVWEARLPLANVLALEPPGGEPAHAVASRSRR